MARVDAMHEPYYSTTGYPTFSHHHGPYSSHHHGHRSQVRSPVSSMGRSTPDSEDYCHQQSKFHMKWILSIGLLLPALAAVIGVVAWAVSAEVVMGARRASALRASEAAFHLSQSPRELEWQSFLDNNEALTPPGPSKGEAKDADYDDNGLDVTTLSSISNSTIVTTSPSTVSLSSSTVKDRFSISPPVSTVSSVTSTQSKRLKHVSSTSSVNSNVVTTTKRPISSIDSSSVTVSPEKSDKNVTNIFFFNGINGDKNNKVDQQSADKKSPGDQVAAVINQLVASRNYKGSTRPQIVVVAPLNEKKKKNVNTSVDSASSVTITTTAPSTTTGSPRTSAKIPSETISTTGKPSTTRSAKSKSTTLKSSKMRSTSTTKVPTTSSTSTTTTTTTTTTEEPEVTTTIDSQSSKLHTKAILSRDADTLMAAAHMLSARHKMISMRSDDENDDETLDNPTIPSKLFSEQFLTTVKPMTTNLPVNRMHYQHFPPPKSVYDSPTVRQDEHQQHQQYPHPQHPHQQHQHHQASQSELSQHQSELLTRNHMNQNFNNHIHQLMHPQGQSPVAADQVNRETHFAGERMPPVSFANHYSSNQILAPNSAIYPMQSPVHMQIRMQPRQQSIHQQQHPQQMQAHPQSEQVPHFVGQMAPQSSSPIIQPNAASIRFAHMQQSPPPPPPAPSAPAHHRLRHQFPGAAGSPLMLQAIQLSPQSQQTSSPAVMMPFASLPLHHQQHSQQQQVTPASNFMTAESSPASINPEGVDESQVISNSAVSPSIDQSASNSNAMLSLHANDPQTAASASKGLTLHFGGGPKSGSSQLMTSPVGIFKTMLLPLFPKPRLNLNGKVVFGVVLDSHINKNKKVIHAV